MEGDSPQCVNLYEEYKEKDTKQESGAVCYTQKEMIVSRVELLYTATQKWSGFH